VVAPRSATALETAPTELWARHKPRGAAHILRPITTLSHEHWTSPCSWLSVDTLDGLDIADEFAPRCSRCEAYLERERISQLDPCSGCASSTCRDCVTPTEERMIGWLANHYGRQHPGNGPRFAFARHVRSRAGFDASTADAVAMDLWESKGLHLHGHEVKISRGDWKNELAKPDKWRPVGRYMDRWWLAVPDLDIVRGGELPDEWGLLLCTPSVTHVVRKAPKMEPDPIDRSFLAALFRAAAKHGVVR
jgi:hypothetical protein